MLQTPNDHRDDTSDPYSAIGCRLSNTSLDLRQAAAYSARARKTAARIAAAEAKAQAKSRRKAEKEAKRLAKQHEKERREVEAEAEAQERKAKRDAAELERKQRRIRQDAEEKAAREERKRKEEEKRQQQKQQKEEEKRRAANMGGVAWGFDPDAGLRRETPLEEPAGCFVSDGKQPQIITRSIDEIAELTELDDIGRRTGRMWHKGNTWGVEAGGPGQALNLKSSHQTPPGSRGTSPWRKSVV